MAYHVGKETADEGRGNLERANDAAAGPTYIAGIYYGEGSPLANSDGHEPLASEHGQPPSNLSLSNQLVKSSWEQFGDMPAQQLHVANAVPCNPCAPVLGCCRTRPVPPK
jgi:hypothetical protein